MDLHAREQKQSGFRYKYIRSIAQFSISFFFFTSSLLQSFRIRGKCVRSIFLEMCVRGEVSRVLYASRELYTSLRKKGSSRGIIIIMSSRWDFRVLLVDISGEERWL